MSSNRVRVVILVVAGVVLMTTGILANNRLITSFVARSVIFAVPIGCILGGYVMNSRERTIR